MLRFSSYLTKGLLILAISMPFGIAQSAEIFIDPTPVYLTGSVGQEFQLELKVDASTLGLRLFQVFIKYQPNLLDTVSFALGPLFENSGYGTFFSSKIVYDTVSGDSAIRIGGLLLGPNAVVDGPGVVAIINLKSNSSGIADLSILGHVLSDIANDTIPSTSAGAIAYLHTPPDSFNLVSPLNGDTVTRFPGEFIQLIWESTSSSYPGESVSYTLEYSDDPAFVSPSTVSLPGLIDTTYDILSDGLLSGPYYWRVRAIGMVNSYMRQSTQYPNQFVFSFGAQAPAAFNLLSPVDGGSTNLFGKNEVMFTWEEAIASGPIDTVEYLYYLGTGPVFPQDSVFAIGSGTSNQVAIPVSSLPNCVETYWTVIATTQFDLFTWATSSFMDTYFTRGDLNCTGGGSPVDVADLTYLVSYIFKGGPAPVLQESGDVNCSGGSVSVDVADLTFFVAFLFNGGPPPDCE